ncbi:hypothetical protein [Pseudomonas sp. RIT357]|uniref:hypothetical protein n=1 Tax=Pseudomonas sp. RIT357 TaxID=1470593 RepID=UPI0004455355|nr:hypothetical protein [Pseudomonas sp. RIT357]EZP64205.1 hypothetical protein BW43_04145 [Pseudomonas sp. RIT357]
MCGRFVHYEGMAIFIEGLNPQMKLFSRYGAVPINSYNVSPTPRVQVLHTPIV